MRSSATFWGGAVLSIALAACGNSSETSSNPGGGGSGGGAAGGQGGSAGSEPASGLPSSDFLPKPTGACPTFAEGVVTVSPDGKARDVNVWVGDATKDLDGPIVFFWHGVGGKPTDALYALGSAVIDDVKAMGGMVVAPVHDPNAGQFPWYLTIGGTDESDLRVMDEVLACAIDSIGVDLRHIHSVGFSAGAMNTTQVGWRRSGYIASVVTFSGAQIGSPPDQDPTNLFPAMVVHGGPEDVVIIKFQDQSLAYAQGLKDAGHFAFVCNHNKKHTVPSDIRMPAWQFLKDHPFGQTPEPYETALPESFPDYCSLTW
ncbi:MAG: hypothetical protein IPK82_25900 [Polyangiaceae bacterium]|nr:hypothetical protein [Polyangiaceae bacterium]